MLAATQAESKQNVGQLRKQSLKTNFGRNGHAILNDMSKAFRSSPLKPIQTGSHPVNNQSPNNKQQYRTKKDIEDELEKDLVEE